MAEQIDSGTHPLDSIVQKIKFPVTGEETGSDNETHHRKPSHLDAIANTPPRLSLDRLQIPAILIDNDLKIVWQNEEAIEDIWHSNSIMSTGSEPPSVFHLLFNANFQSSVENWRQWVSFFLKLGLGMASYQQVSAVIEDQNERCRNELRSLLADLAQPQSSNVFNGRIRQVQNNNLKPGYWVVSVDFSEGRLVIFDPDTNNSAYVQPDRHLDFNNQASEPVEKPICFIAAQVNNADTIQTAMLPKDHGHLLSHVWKKGVETIEQFGGVVNHVSGNRLIGYFIPEDALDENPLAVIQCALELRSQIAAIGRQWKIRSGWLHHIETNIGIHFSNEFVDTVATSAGRKVATLGNGLEMATWLSGMASNGEIWASKNMINRLPMDTLQHINFGIFRSENKRRLFVERGFARIKDLSMTSHPPVSIPDTMMTLIATQIFDTQI